MQLLDPNGHPGMGGIISQYPFIGKMVAQLGEAVMRGGPLPQVQCEYIAWRMSKMNVCSYCADSHEAVFEQLAIRDEVYYSFQDRTDFFEDIVVCIARKQPLAPEKIKAAVERLGMDTDEIAHAIAVASAFCFFNGLVHSFGGRAATDEELKAVGILLSSKGYLVDGSDLI